MISGVMDTGLGAGAVTGGGVTASAIVVALSGVR